MRRTCVIHLDVQVHSVPSVGVDEKPIVAPFPVLTAVVGAFVVWKVHVVHKLSVPAPHDTRIPARASLACRWAICIASTQALSTVTDARAQPQTDPSIACEHSLSEQPHARVSDSRQEAVWSFLSQTTKNKFFYNTRFLKLNFISHRQLKGISLSTQCVATVKDLSTFCIGTSHKARAPHFRHKYQAACTSTQNC